MILVWDNEQEYTAHCIHFVQLDEQVASREMLEAMVEARADHEVVAGRKLGGFIIMWAEKFDWRLEDDVEPLWKFLDPDFFTTSSADGQQRVLIESVWRGPVVSKLWRLWHAKLKPLLFCGFEWGGTTYDEDLKLIAERLRREGWL